MISNISEKYEPTEGTVLLVDDQPEQIDIIKSALEPCFSVRVAIRGELAIKIAMAGGVDLILLDVMMPVMDGYEVCQKLKSDPTTRSIPVIFLTGKNSQDDEAVGLALGAVDYIRKPSSPSVVLTRCRNTIIHERTKETLHRKNEELGEKNRQLEELNKILANLATTDGLTGIANRRRFDEYLIQEWNRGLRDGTPLSIIVMDIDYFKSFNDHYGHAAGDECLIKVARRLASSMVRAIDLMARYGGEEFVCVLPNTDVAGVVVVGNQIRKSINDLCVPHGYSNVAPHVTLSLGGATLVPAKDASPFLLVGMADARLYKAKEMGRNCLVVDDQPESVNQKQAVVL